MLILTAVLGGCQSIEYYSQAMGGQVDIWSRQRDIEAVLSDPDTDPRLRGRLEAALQARRFASEQLGLPDNGSYTRYADLGRDYVVWNVVAAPRYSVEPIESCFPVVGCVGYRGYFDRARAEAWAEQQSEAGMDVYIGGVSAYSTLGWFDDPLLNTMLSRSEAAIAALIFHELAHQRIFIQGDTRFNESFATAVEEIGLQAWADSQGDQAAVQAYLLKRGRQSAIIGLLLEARERLRVKYTGNAGFGESRLAGIKEAEFAGLRNHYAMLREAGQGTPGFDRFFETDLNNASLALFGAYHGWVASFEQIFEQSSGDWFEFFSRVEDMARLSSEERNKRLANLLD